MTVTSSSRKYTVSCELAGVFAAAWLLLLLLLLLACSVLTARVTCGVRRGRKLERAACGLLSSQWQAWRAE